MATYKKIVVVNAQCSGNINFIKGRGLSSEVIMWIAGRECSHNSITYYDLRYDGWYVAEMVRQGFIRTPIEEWYYNHERTLVKVAQPIAFTEAQQFKLNMIITEDIGKIHYNTGGLLKFVWKKFACFDDPTELFCSEEIGTHLDMCKFQIIPGLKPREQTPEKQMRQIGKTLKDVTDDIIKIKVFG